MGAALVEAGAQVVITGRQHSRAKEVAAGLGPTASGLELDVRDAASVQSGIEEAYGRLGGLDMLVNNAGLGMRRVNPRFMSEPQPFWEVPADGFRDVLETKVTGCFLVARAVVPRMLKAGAGRMVTISMSEATMIRRGFVPYGPSGAAVEAMARVMAADLEETPVRANVLLPGGASDTGMIPDDVPDEIRAQLLDPAVMGPPIVWLASREADDVHDERIVATEFEDWLAQRGATDKRQQ
jgi:gluconate 5-dehydrogenase